MRLGSGTPPRWGLCILVALAVPPIDATAQDASAETVKEAEEAADAGEGAEEEYRNSITFGFNYLHAFLKPREGTEGESLDENENLYGFSIGYERVLIPSHLAILIAKPLVFNRERFDSPLEVLLKGLFRRRRWEPFIGLGLASNLRVFSGEREQKEGRKVEFGVGVLAATGLTYVITRHWGVEVEFGYTYFFNVGSVSEHEITSVLNGVYYFQRGQRNSRTKR